METNPLAPIRCLIINFTLLPGCLFTVPPTLFSFFPSNCIFQVFAHRTCHTGFTNGRMAFRAKPTGGKNREYMACRNALHVAFCMHLNSVFGESIATSSAMKITHMIDHPRNGGCVGASLAPLSSVMEIPRKRARYALHHPT